MQAFFWFGVVISIIGWYVGNETRVRRWFYTSHDTTFSTTHWGKRTQIYVNYIDTKPEKVKPKIIGATYSDRNRLSKDIEIVTNGKMLASSFNDYTYRQILASLTPEQIESINEMRSFLK